MIRIADYLRNEPDVTWSYARQLGIRYAVGRMPDGHMDETAADLGLLRAMKARYDDAGFKLAAIEPAPLNQKIKQGLPGRDEELENMLSLIRNMGKLGIEVLCYNFTAHFNWIRTAFDYPERGGALVTRYLHSDADTPGLTEAGEITHEKLWKNLEYMLRAIVPEAEKAGVLLAMHPDDPPVPSVKGVGRILTSADAVWKAINLVPSPNSGVCMCQGTFAAMGENVPDCIMRFGSAGKINLIHFRDIRGEKYDFHETFQDDGMTDMAECVLRYRAAGVDCFGRVDHVPTLAGEENALPGYEALGRLFAVGYLRGLCEMSGKVPETN